MWSETFDRAAASYDDPSLRFFDLGADALVAAVAPRPGERVLDLATGTGKVARRAAAAVGIEGSVTAVDVSREMLGRARANLADARVALAAMDAERLALRDRSFEVVTCGFGVSFFRSPVGAMREAARALVPGGRVGVCTPAHGAFEPQLGVLFEVLAATGRPRPAGRRPALDSPAAVDRLLARAGFVDRVVDEVPIAYDLAPDAFWAVVLGTAWRSAIRGLPDETVEAIRHGVLDRLSARVDRTLSVPTIVASARSPATAGDRLRTWRDATLRPVIGHVVRP